MADASIFAQYLKPVKSVAEYQDEGDARTLSRLKLLLGQQEAQQKQQGFADDAKFRGLTMQYGNDQAGLLNALRSGGLYGKAKDIEAGIADIASKKATTDKAIADTKKLNAGMFKDDVTQAASAIFANPDIEAAKAAVIRIAKKHEQDPTPDLNELAQITDATQLQRWAAGKAMSVEKLLPKTQTGEYGGYKQPEAVDIFGKVTATGPQVTVTENETQRLSRERQEAQAKATLAQSASQFALQHGQRQKHHDDNQNRSKTQYDPARGGLVDMQTGEFKPAMQGGVPIGPKATPLKDAPASVQKAMMENSSSLRKAQAALDLIEGKDVGVMKGDKNATGWKGFTPDFALNRLDPEGVDARAAISDLGSMIIHDRSGAAVTAAEFPRLQPFIPKANDAPEVAKKKLQRFVQVYSEELTAMQNAYGPDSGYRQPGGITPPAAPKPPGGMPGMADIDAEIARRRGGK